MIVWPRPARTSSSTAPPPLNLSSSHARVSSETPQKKGTGMRRFMIAVLLGCSMILPSTPAHAATGLTPDRTCKNFITGDGTYRLSVCSRGYNGAGVVRGVVEMHTYVWDPFTPGNWDDSVSQSITLNSAHLLSDYGNGFSTKCRVNGPAGSVGCSVPHTSRVAFYGPAGTNPSSLSENFVWGVSWRDAQGTAHYADQAHPTNPDSVPIYFSWLS
jgi:hypothetical protein